MKLFSPAKINLFFRVKERRADGYHAIESRVQALDFGDEMIVTPSSADFFSHPTVPPDLLLRALALFRQKTGSDLHCTISLTKRIFMEAGLGGGSSNAATLLYAANQLAGTNLSTADLQALGAKLGADVPFFFSSGCADTAGIGEIVTDAPSISGEVWLAKPEYGLSTPAVFARHRPNTARNELEEAALSLRPELAALKEELSLHFEEVWMTGSGSTFVCRGGNPVPMEGVAFAHANFLTRKETSWYTPEACVRKSTTTSSLSLQAPPV